MNPTRRSFALACAATLALAATALAAPAAMAATPQPALAAMVKPYEDALRRENIFTLTVRPDSSRVLLATEFGAVYFRYPSGLAPTAFVVRVEKGELTVESDAFTPANAAQYEAAVKAVLPEAIRRANDNNRMWIDRRNSDR